MTMKLYKVRMKGFINDNYRKKNRVPVQIFKDNITFGKFNDELSIIADGISKESANNIVQYLNSLGCIVNIETSTKTAYTEQETRTQQYFNIANAPIHCPRCGSKQISTGQRGFSIVTGFIGSNKTVNRCANCGYSWKP